MEKITRDGVCDVEASEAASGLSGSDDDGTYFLVSPTGRYLHGGEATNMIGALIRPPGNRHL
jgi:hypothetical protein